MENMPTNKYKNVCMLRASNKQKYWLNVAENLCFFDKSIFLRLKVHKKRQLGVNFYFLTEMVILKCMG